MLSILRVRHYSQTVWLFLQMDLGQLNSELKWEEQRGQVGGLFSEVCIFMLNWNLKYDNLYKSKLTFEEIIRRFIHIYQYYFCISCYPTRSRSLPLGKSLTESQVQQLERRIIPENCCEMNEF